MSKSNGQSNGDERGLGLGLDNVLDAAVDQMPDVTSHGEAVIEEALSEPDDLADSELNALGDGADVFNPDVHEVDIGGRPITNADGSFRRKRGRKKGINYGGGGEIVVSDEAKAKAAAAATVNTLLALAQGVFGDEWTPIADKKIGIDERANLLAAFEAYYVQSGTIAIPPGLGLAVALGCYALPRAQAPTTKGKLARFGGWVKGWFVKADSGE